MVGWIAAFLAAFAGTLGGLVNAILTDNGFVMPKYADTADGGKILRPGLFGNVAVGAIAALISWALYGSGAGTPILSTTHVDLTWAGFAAAMMVGVGGSRWLTGEVDKALLRNTAAQAAKAQKSDSLAIQLAVLSPAQALAVVNKAA